MYVAWDVGCSTWWIYDSSRSTRVPSFNTRATSSDFPINCLIVSSSCVQLSLYYKQRVWELYDSIKSASWSEKHTWFRSSTVLNRKFSAMFRGHSRFTKSYLIGQYESPNLGIVFTGLDFQKWLKRTDVTVKVVARKLVFFITTGPSRSTNGQMIIIWNILESRKLFVARLKLRLVV